MLLIGFAGLDFAGFRSRRRAIPGDAAWNNISDIVFSVPELSTWAMMALGFVGLGYAAYRGAGRFRYVRRKPT